MAVIPRQGKDKQPPATTDADLRRHSQELGMLGKIFGGRDQAPINIAGMIVVIGVVALLAMPFFPNSPDFSKADQAKVFGSLILAALTFLGGYLGAGKRQL